MIWAQQGHHISNKSVTLQAQQLKGLEPFPKMLFPTSVQLRGFIITIIPDKNCEGASVESPEMMHSAPLI